MSDPMSRLADEIHVEHRDRRSGVGKGSCVACREKWPCKPLRLAAMVLDLTSFAVVPASQKSEEFGEAS